MPLGIMQIMEQTEHEELRIVAFVGRGCGIGRVEVIPSLVSLQHQQLTSQAEAWCVSISTSCS